MAPLIHGRIFGSSGKSMFEQDVRDFDAEDVSYVELLRVIYECEETRTMASIECDVSQKIDCNDSKYTRRLKAKRREQQKRLRRTEKKRLSQDSGKSKKYMVEMVMDRSHSALAEKGCNVVYRYRHRD